MLSVIIVINNKIYKRYIKSIRTFDLASYIFFDMVIKVAQN